MTTFVILLLVVVVVIAAKVILSQKQEKTARERREDMMNGVDKKDVQLPKDINELPAEIQTAIRNGKKLEAVKLYRNYTKCSLAEANAVIQEICG